MDWNEAIFLGLGLADLLGLAFVVGTVWGIRLMSSPTTAVRGNLIGAVSMAGAIIVTLVAENIVSVQVLWIGMAVGGAFNDTPVINGEAYPYLEVDPTVVRFRILNAANDRFLNLSWFVADSSVVTSDLRTNTEVKMVPAISVAGWPVDP